MCSAYLIGHIESGNCQKLQLIVSANVTNQSQIKAVLMEVAIAFVDGLKSLRYSSFNVKENLRRLSPVGTFFLSFYINESRHAVKLLSAQSLNIDSFQTHL